MSIIEFALLGMLLLGLLAANGLASHHVYRDFGHRGRPYLYLIWLVPVLGALFILAHTRARPGSVYSIRDGNTLLHKSPPTLMFDP